MFGLFKLGGFIQGCRVLRLGEGLALEVLLVQLVDDVAFFLLQTLDVSLKVSHVFFVLNSLDHLVYQLGLVLSFLELVFVNKLLHFIVRFTGLIHNVELFNLTKSVLKIFLSDNVDFVLLVELGHVFLETYQLLI